MFEVFSVFFEVLGVYFFFDFWGFLRFFFFWVFEVFWRFFWGFWGLKTSKMLHSAGRSIFWEKPHWGFLTFLWFFVFWGGFFLRLFNFWCFLRVFFSQNKFWGFEGFLFLKTHYWGLETHFWRNSPKLLSLRKKREREREREFSEVSETWRNFWVFGEMLRMWSFLRIGVISERYVSVETFWGFGGLT